MRIALFSDVHGNLSAFRAIRDDIEGRADFDQVIFAGDLCLFGPRPQECLALLRDLSALAIVGNTDEWIRQPPPLPDDMPDPQRAGLLAVRALCQWTEEQLSAESLAWLDDLRQSFHIRLTPSSNPDDDLLIVHANPRNLLDIIFPSVERQLELYGRIRQTDEELAPLLEEEPAPTIVFGHLHIPGVRHWRDKTLVNISSVSLPGDGDGRAKYAILAWRDDAGWRVEHVKLEYDVAPEINAFRHNRPPAWQDRVDQLKTLGYIPQVV